MKNSIKLLTALAFATLAINHPTRAGSHTWSGANSIYFNNASNWSFGGAPSAGEQNVYLYFPAGVLHYTISNNIPGLTVSIISFSGDNYTLSGNSITLTGGTNLMSSGNMNVVALPLVLGGSNTAASVAGGKFLFLSNPLSGASHFSKVGPGTLRLNCQSPNVYTGTTYVTEGTLQLGGNAQDTTVPGALVVGTGAGSPGTAVAQLLSGNQIPNSSIVTVNNSGVLDGNGNYDWIGGLVLGGSGKVQTGLSKFALAGDVTVLSGAPTIDGRIWLMNGTRTFNANPGGALTIDAILECFDDSAGIIKTGAGSVTLKAVNNFAGPVTVKQGYLNLANNGALGNGSELIVTNIGVVQLFGVDIARTLKLAGNGTGYGALRSAGTNSWSGFITLAADSAIECNSASDLLNLNGPIAGPAALTKLGAGRLVLAGNTGNSYHGTTTAKAGTLQLSKTNAIAIPAALVIGDATNAAGSHVVQLTGSHQIADLAEVTVNASGSLYFTPSATDETVGSLAGAGGVNLSFCHLRVGTNNASTTFSGTISGLNNVCSLTKDGTGKFFLNGISWGFSGSTYVNAGLLSVNGSIPSSPFVVSSGATLSGDGATGPVSGFGGKIAPGNSPGLLTTMGSFNLNSGFTLEAELNGTTAGVTYDRINVTGSVSLGNATLNLLLGFNSAVSNKFVIIANDGNDAVTGTFKNLPEGAQFFAGNAQYQISYHGGDGNDVDLTQIGVVTPSQISGVQNLGNGQMQINGTGVAGSSYDIEANSDLNTANWTKIGTVQADVNGLISFTDINAASFPIRFYRFKGN